MERELIYRGKCQPGYDYSDGTGWIYGSLLTNGEESAIVKDEDLDLSTKTDDGIQNIEDFAFIPIVNQTTGKQTGSKDKNGNFFEVTVSKNESSLYSREFFEQSEIIGNIHDNPDLLK